MFFSSRQRSILSAIVLVLIVTGGILAYLVKTNRLHLTAEDVPLTEEQLYNELVANAAAASLPNCNNTQTSSSTTGLLGNLSIGGSSGSGSSTTPLPIQCPFTLTDESVGSTITNQIKNYIISAEEAAEESYQDYLNQTKASSSTDFQPYLVDYGIAQVTITPSKPIQEIIGGKQIVKVVLTYKVQINLVGANLNTDLNTTKQKAVRVAHFNEKVPFASTVTSINGKQEATLNEGEWMVQGGYVLGQDVIINGSYKGSYTLNASGEDDYHQNLDEMFETADLKLLQYPYRPGLGDARYKIIYGADNIFGDIGIHWVNGKQYVDSLSICPDGCRVKIAVDMKVPMIKLGVGSDLRQGTLDLTYTDESERFGKATVTNSSSGSDKIVKWTAFEIRRKTNLEYSHILTLPSDPKFVDNYYRKENTVDFQQPLLGLGDYAQTIEANFKANRSDPVCEQNTSLTSPDLEVGQQGCVASAGPLSVTAQMNRIEKRSTINKQTVTTFSGTGSRTWDSNYLSGEYRNEPAMTVTVSSQKSLIGTKQDPFDLPTGPKPKQLITYVISAGTVKGDSTSRLSLEGGAMKSLPKNAVIIKAWGPSDPLNPEFSKDYQKALQILSLAKNLRGGEMFINEASVDTKDKLYNLIKGTTEPTLFIHMGHGLPGKVQAGSSEDSSYAGAGMIKLLLEKSGSKFYSTACFFSLSALAPEFSSSIGPGVFKDIAVNQLYGEIAFGSDVFNQTSDSFMNILRAHLGLTNQVCSNP